MKETKNNIQKNREVKTNRESKLCEPRAKTLRKIYMNKPFDDSQDISEYQKLFIL